MRSKVCQEELSLAIALHQQNQCKVIPLIIEPVKENIDWFKNLCPMECFATSAETEGTTISTTACEMIIRELKGENIRKSKPVCFTSADTPRKLRISYSRKEVSYRRQRT